MTTTRTALIALLVGTALGACSGKTTDTNQTSGPAACQGQNCTASADGVGDVCTQEDESNADFGGFAATDVNVESQSAQCRTGICLGNHFQGRVSCPYGGSSCTTTAGAPVSVPVPPELVARPPGDAVYCSCRCDGPAGTGPFCACPTGYECTHLVDDIGLGHAELAGSYCIQAGTAVDDATALESAPACDAALHNCDDR